MVFRFTYLCFLSAALLLSCKKDEQKPTPEMRQRVFTNGTEIKDEGVKKRFIQQSGIPFTVPTALGPDDVIRFVTPDTATFGTSTIRFYVTKNGTQHLFYSPQIVFQTSNNRASDNDIRKFLKHTVPLIPVLILPTEFSYITQEVRVGYGDRSNIRLSFLHYRLKRTSPDGRGNSDWAGSLFNEFNEAAIATVGAGDTLAIQESSFLVPVQ